MKQLKKLKTPSPFVFSVVINVWILVGFQINKIEYPEKPVSSNGCKNSTAIQISLEDQSNFGKSIKE